MYNSTLTLFNYHEGSGEWYTTVFNDTDLIAARAASQSTHGTSNGDGVEIIIHTDADRSVNGKRYLGSKAYAKCEDPGANFTFTLEKDFLIVGDHGSESPLEDDDDIGLYHSMNDENDNVYMVTSATFFSLIPHFEIGGK